MDLNYCNLNDIFERIDPKIPYFIVIGTLKQFIKLNKKN